MDFFFLFFPFQGADLFIRRHLSVRNLSVRFTEPLPVSVGALCVGFFIFIFFKLPVTLHVSHPPQEARFPAANVVKYGSDEFDNSVFR